VTALVDAIIARGTLSGDEVDAIIMQAVAAKALADEQARRADWRRVEQSAALFLADTVRSSW
jgi:phage terminase large subunit-like protein